MADKRDNRRRQIIGAVASCASEEGMGAVTFRNVAKRIGYTTGMVTYYYESRSALLTDTLLAADRAIRDRVVDRVGERLDVEWLLAYFDEAFSEDPAHALPWSFWLEYWASATRDDELAAQSVRRAEYFERDVQDALRCGIEDGILRADLDVEGSARLVSSVTHGLAVEAGLGRTQSRTTLLALLGTFCAPGVDASQLSLA